MAAVGTGQPLSQPIQGLALVDKDGIVTQVWWRFFFGLFTRNASTVPYLVSTALTATGTTQADALALESEWNEITSTPANTGVRLSGFGVGLNSVVFNQGGGNLKIYPPVGGAIDALGTDNPFTLANNTVRDFYQLTATQFRSR
jgi:hypothetical protein